MRQNANPQNNSHSESSEKQIQQICARLYSDHRKEIRMWRDITQPVNVELDLDLYEAFIGCMQELSKEYGLDVIAAELEDIILKELLVHLSHADSLTFTERYQITSQIEKLMKVARIFRFIERHIFIYKPA